MEMEWSEAEANYVRENAHRLSDIELTVRLNELTGKNFSKTMIAIKRQSFGMIRETNFGKNSRVKLKMRAKPDEKA